MVLIVTEHACNLACIHAYYKRRTIIAIISHILTKIKKK